MTGDRALVVSMALSAVFHLSMITVFSIVIIYPAERVTYLPLELIDPATNRSIFLSADRPALSLPSMTELFAESDGGVKTDADAQTSVAELPSITLPTVGFADTAKIESWSENLRLGANLEYERPTVSRGWLEKEIGSLRQTLSALVLRMGADEDRQIEPIVAVGSPAPGYTARIKWLTRPKDRGVLYAPPITALWSIDPTELAEPIHVTFQVNAQGKVTNVFQALSDDGGAISQAAHVLQRYRFDALSDDGSRLQEGVLIVAAEGAAP